VRIDPRFELRTEERGGQVALGFTATRGFLVEEIAPLIAVLSLDELCDLAGVPAAVRSAMKDGSSRAIMTNGWQSWSFAGELHGRERVMPARFIRKLDLFNLSPGAPLQRKNILSHLWTYLRVGESRLVLLSRGAPGSARPLPPISFRFDRKSLDLGIEAYAEGARFAAGETVAELRLFYREGYFAMKSELRAAFRDYGHFERLGFLGAGGALVPGGYESWYNHYLDIDDAAISRDLAGIGSSANLINEFYIGRGKPTVFQIDDGWERSVGDWASDAMKFPRGMKVLAEEIEAKGMIPGIWVAPLLVMKGGKLARERPEWLLSNEAGMPVVAGWNPGWGGDFNCLDLSLPEVGEHLQALFDTLVEEWGYRYLKLDFLYAGFLRGARRRGGAAYEHFDRVMHRITSRIVNSRGLPVAYLGCGAPLEPSFTHFPLMRIGADTREAWDMPEAKFLRHQGRPSAYVNMTDTIGRCALDGTVFINDPDVVFCREEKMKLGEGEKELVALVGFMLASQIMFSDDAYGFGKGGEEAFTRRIVALLDRLGGREYGAERIAKDVYRVFSEEGGIAGIINLSNRSVVLDGFDPSRAILLHASTRGSLLRFERRSISLFEAG
jgi:alpha-galactosidase